MSKITGKSRGGERPCVMAIMEITVFGQNLSANITVKAKHIIDIEDGIEDYTEIDFCVQNHKNPKKIFGQKFVHF